MSQNNKNDEMTIVIMIFSVIGMVALAFFLMVAAVLGFLCFIMTILSLIAWNRPLNLGRLSIQPEQAREFVLRGLLFALTIPAFYIFCGFIFDYPILLEAIGYIALGGYVFGSIGIELMDEDERTVTAPPATYHPPQQQALPPTQPQRYLPAPEPFRYASWDDEEENRR